MSSNIITVVEWGSFKVAEEQSFGWLGGWTLGQPLGGWTSGAGNYTEEFDGHDWNCTDAHLPAIDGVALHAQRLSQLLLCPAS